MWQFIFFISFIVFLGIVAMFSANHSLGMAVWFGGLAIMQLVMLKQAMEENR